MGCQELKNGYREKNFLKNCLSADNVPGYLSFPILLTPNKTLVVINTILKGRDPGVQKEVTNS